MEREFFYQSVAFRLLAANRAYHAYLEHRSYVLARSIFQINQENLRFICENIHKADIGDVEGLIELVVHWSQWMEQFKSHVINMSPRPDSEFIFHPVRGTTSYPATFASEIISRAGFANVNVIKSN
jgi:hypothetical protein